VRVLVTGSEGDIGFGIGRVLKNKYSDLFLVGIDIVDGGTSCCVFDLFEKSPPAKSEFYKTFILELIEKLSIDVIIPTSEAEISTFWGSDIVTFLREAGKLVVILNQEIVNKALDKYKTYLFLRENNFAFPSTVLANEFIEEDSYGKRILKPRVGQGSKGIRVITSSNDIHDYELNDQYIVQELLSDDENEYTCCVYRDNTNTREIILKRKMRNGFTVSGEVVEDASIRKYILDISNKFGLIGSMNLQLRMTDRGPVLFEINPRFSSTVVFRDKMGFSDLYWELERQLSNKIPAYIKPKNGLKFYRGIKEYFLD